MKLYKTNGGGKLRWAGSSVDAGKQRKELVGSGTPRKHIETAIVEITPTKTGLLEWLNTNMSSYQE